MKSIFIIPEFLLNRYADNILKIFNAVLTEQLKLLEGNLKYVAGQSYHNLSSQLFVADLYNIVLGDNSYSINLLLEKFKKLIK